MWMVSETNRYYIILKFRSCAPFQYKESEIEEGSHSVFRNTSISENFDKAMEINRNQCLHDQCPESCSSRVASQALEKIIGESKN